MQLHACVLFVEYRCQLLKCARQAIDKLKIPHQGIIAKDFMDGREKLVVSFIWRLITT